MVEKANLKKVVWTNMQGVSLLFEVGPFTFEKYAVERDTVIEVTGLNLFRHSIGRSSTLWGTQGDDVVRLFLRQRSEEFINWAEEIKNFL